MERRKFMREFKVEAVKLIQERVVTVAQAARDLGVHGTVLRRLLRQYFPKGTNLSPYSQADLNRIAVRLNQRPRETLGFQTPAAILEAGVALTA
jgi:transposase-like protein